MQQRWIPFVMTIGCLTVAGCGGGGQGAGNSARHGAPAGGEAKSSTTECPVGRYRVTKMVPGAAVDTGDLDVRLSGGTSMTIEFTDDGKWTLGDNGKRPLRARVSAPGVGSVSGSATVRGELTGTYVRSGSSFGFRRDGGSGSVALRSAAGNDRKSITAVGEALAPSGTADIKCSGDKATVKSENVTMTLKRVGGAGARAGEGAGGGDTSGGSGGGASATGTLVLKGQRKVHNVICDGRSVVVEGSTMTANLAGTCPQVRVTGDRNTVNARAANSVVITGSNNVINIAGAASGGPAKVDDQGSANIVNQR